MHLNRQLGAADSMPITRQVARSISRILSKRNSLEKKVDTHVINGIKKLFPRAFKDGTVDPARSAIMASVSNIGALAFGAYSEPMAGGFKEEAENQATVSHLQCDLTKSVMEGALKITLKDAKHLRNADIPIIGKSDPYVVFTAGGSCVKSKVIDNNNNPIWNSTHYLFLRKRQLSPVTDKHLTISCIDDDKCRGPCSFFNFFNKDDLLGSSTLPLEQLKKEGIQPFELELKHSQKKKKRPSTIRFTTEFISVDLAFKEMNIDKDSNAWPPKLQSRALEWMEVSTMADSSMLEVEKVAYIDAPSTGTQAWVHANTDTKVVVVAFRGTEISCLQDVICDANFLPVPLNDDKLKQTNLKHSPQYLDKGNRVHSGFKKAYDSVRESILRIVYDLTNWDHSWTVIVTGHSLGGALATLCAFEFRNCWIFHPRDVWKLGRSEIIFPWKKLLKGPKICMMNFGAPRVGNESFVKNYNQTMRDTLRVVNANDLVHYLPPFFYDHTNFEVLLRDSGNVRIHGVDFQSGHTREIRDMLDSGRVKEEDIQTKAFSHYSVLQHLGSHYLSLVRVAVQKFTDRLIEVQECIDAIAIPEET